MNQKHFDVSPVQHLTVAELLENACKCATMSIIHTALRIYTACQIEILAVCGNGAQMTSPSERNDNSKGAMIN
eukprot:scaffold478069_cov50-Prasinocladus_malaysianus.AAC.1